MADSAYSLWSEGSFGGSVLSAASDRSVLSTAETGAVMGKRSPNALCIAAAALVGTAGLLCWAALAQR
ncbi:MAG: hypothetical protein ABR536_03630 [Solirubrobacterales bacterium]